MALSSRGRRGRTEINVWPGWVDALSSLVIVVIFVVLVFVMAQSFLQGTLAQKNDALAKLNSELARLANLLAVEQQGSMDAKDQIARLTAELADAQSKLATAADQTRGIEDRDTQLAALNQQVDALREQLARIEADLATSQADNAAQQTKIDDLTGRLNSALLNKVEQLAKYRSEFFGRLREVLSGRSDIRIVGDRFMLQSELLFPSGSADLQPEGKQKLQELSGVLINLSQRIPADIPWVLEVEGHTDRRPIDTPQFHSNWELSTARAVAVARYLIAQGLPADRISAAGFAEFQPIDSGTDDAALARNRRIEFKFDQK